MVLLQIQALRVADSKQKKSPNNCQKIRYFKT